MGEVNTQNCEYGNERFGDEFEDAAEDELIDGQRSKNTVKNTKGAIKAFDDFRQYYARKYNQPVPQLLSMDAMQLNMWLGRFAHNARKKDGKYYHPRSLYLLFSSINRFLRENGSTINILDEKNVELLRFRQILDAKMKWLHQNGFGGRTAMADPVTEEEERMLWESGEFGDHSSEALMHTIYFYNCKLFGLRSRDEHRGLQKSQFSVGENELGKFVEFDGRTNKTFKGGIHQLNKNPKSVRHYSPHDAEPNISEMYKIFLDFISDGPLYMKPLDNMGNLLRYGKQPVGVNTLSNIMPKICTRAGITRHTGHSGKVTLATNLYHAGVDEQLIKERTGHSSSAVQLYKRTSEMQRAKISAILDPPQRKSRKLNDSEGNTSKQNSGDDSRDIVIGFDVPITEEELQNTVDGLKKNDNEFEEDSAAATQEMFEEYNTDEPTTSTASVPQTLVQQITQAQHICETSNHSSKQSSRILNAITSSVSKASDTKTLCHALFSGDMHNPHIHFHFDKN